MIIPLAKQKTSCMMYTLADPTAAPSGPSDGQAPSFAYPKHDEGGVAEFPSHTIPSSSSGVEDDGTAIPVTS